MTFFPGKKCPFSRPKFLMTFFSHRPGFSDFALFTVIKYHIRPFVHKKNHYFRKEFLHKTILYSVHPFSKYWGDQCMGRPHTSNFWEDSPPVPQVSAPVRYVRFLCVCDLARIWRDASTHFFFRTTCTPHVLSEYRLRTTAVIRNK